MRLFKIKNKYLFNSDNPNGIHTYAVYYDNKSRENRAVALTHLYVKDNNRFKQVKNGLISIEKFKEFDTPSGVKNYYYTKSINGQKIRLNDNENLKLLSNRYLSKEQSDRIKKFAIKNYNK